MSTSLPSYLQTVSDVIRTCLGPKAMLKMILDPMGGILLTNDGNAILREIEVAHPAAKSMIELSRTQDEEVGDGTTSVIILGAYYGHTLIFGLSSIGPVLLLFLTITHHFAPHAFPSASR